MGTYDLLQFAAGAAWPIEENRGRLSPDQAATRRRDFSNGKQRMRETWLRPNRRAILFGCVPPLIVAVMGAWLAFATGDVGGSFWRWAGFALIAVSLVLIGILMSQFRRPRISFQDGMVQFNVRIGAPIAVPVGIV